MCTLITVAFVSGANLLLDYGDYLPFFLLFVIKGFCFGGLQFLPVAMLADVVDVDAVRSGGRRAGTYFAFLGFTEKIAVAFGTGVSLNHRWSARIRPVGRDRREHGRRCAFAAPGLLPQPDLLLRAWR